MAVEPHTSVVCNCGPLIALAGIRQLELLPRLFTRVRVPGQVHAELCGSRDVAPWTIVADNPAREVKKRELRHE